MDTAITLLVLLVAVLAIAAVARLTVFVITVHDHERGLRYRRGVLAGLTGPGVHLGIRPLTEIRVMDVRPTSITVEGQEVLTSDGVAVKLSLVARYVVGDAAAAVTRDASYTRAMYLALQLALRDAVAGRTLAEVLAARGSIGGEVREACLAQLTELGLDLIQVEVRDLMLPGELKRAFAGVIAARKEGEAALERARAETAALRGLANAGRMLDDNPGLLQLRILQEVGGSTGNTVVFGAPEAAVVRAPGPSATGRRANRGARGGTEAQGGD